MAWQLAERKRSCWLKEPDKWWSYKVLQDAADIYEPMSVPAGSADEDVVFCEMQPSDVLWNIELTPHWVVALDEFAYSINLTHHGITCEGQSSPIDLELAGTKREREANQTSRKLATSPLFERKTKMSIVRDGTPHP